MALTDFLIEFSKDWNNSEDFQTYESDEGQVRADLQLLHDEMRDQVNRFLTECTGADLPFASSDAVPADNMQAAVEELRRQIANTQAGVVVPDSIETAMIQDGQVTTDKLDDEAVTTPKLDDGSVTLAKLDLGGTVTPAALGAANTIHSHDDLYYTEGEADGLLSHKMNLPEELVPLLGGVVADDDLVPVYDDSEEGDRAITWAQVKAALKAYFDNGVYESQDTAHHTRHEEGGSDQVTITAGNIADRVDNIGAVSSIYEATVPAREIDYDSPYWEEESGTYTQTVAVTDLAAEEDCVSVAFAYDGDEAPEWFSDITFTAEEDALTGSSTTEITEDFSVKVTQVVEETRDNETVEVEYRYTVSFPAYHDKSTWTAIGTPFIQTIQVRGLHDEETAAISLPDSPQQPTSVEREDFANMQITGNEVSEGRLKITALNKSTCGTEEDPFYIRVIVVRTYSVPTVPNSGWEGTEAPYTQDVAIEGLPSGNYDPVNHKGAKITVNGTTTTSTGNGQTAYTRVTSKELVSDGGRVHLIADTTKPGYDFQLTLAVEEYYDVVLDPDGWTGTGGPWVTEIDVPGLLESDYPVVDLAADTLLAKAEEQLSAWASIYKMVCDDDNLTLYAQEEPMADVPLRLLCVRK